MVETQESSQVIRVRDLSKVYHMGEVQVHALRGIDLDVEDGELVVMLGHSGSGKSTLLNVLGGSTRLPGDVFGIETRS